MEEKLKVYVGNVKLVSKLARFSKIKINLKTIGRTAEGT